MCCLNKVKETSLTTRPRSTRIFSAPSFAQSIRQMTYSKDSLQSDSLNHGLKTLVGNLLQSISPIGVGFAFVIRVLKVVYKKAERDLMYGDQNSLTTSETSSWLSVNLGGQPAAQGLYRRLMRVKRRKLLMSRRWASRLRKHGNLISIGGWELGSRLLSNTPVKTRPLRFCPPLLRLIVQPKCCLRI
jgi:hypothetical protein